VYKRQLFTTSDGSTRVHHEIECYASGSGAFWIRAPSLTDDTDADFYIYYGDDLDHTDDAGYLASGTWNENFIAVWHFNETTGNILDSTTYKNSGQVTNPDELHYCHKSGGIAGKAHYFEQTGNETKVNSWVSMKPMGAGAALSLFTVEGWLNLNRWKQIDNNRFGDMLAIDGANNADEDWPMQLDTNQGNSIGLENTGLYCTSTLPSGNLGAKENWVYYVGCTDNVTSEVYFNGEQEGTSETDLSIRGNWVMCNNTAGAEPTDTMMDEIRVSNVRRSAGWIKTTFRNISSNSTFWRIASQETPSAGDTTDWETSVGSATSWSWTSGAFDADNSIRATSATPTTWSWAVVSSSVSLFYRSGNPTHWVWVSGAS